MTVQPEYNLFDRHRANVCLIHPNIRFTQINIYSNVRLIRHIFNSTNSIPKVGKVVIY